MTPLTPTSSEESLAAIRESVAQATLQHRANPLRADARFRAHFFEQLGRASIASLSDLVIASHLLDWLRAERLHRSQAVKHLRQQVRIFVCKFPQLSQMGWVHAGGEVEALMGELREAAARGTA